MSITANNRTQRRQRKLDREAMAALIRKNAEDLAMALCGKGFERAYNPDCLPKRRRRQPAERHGSRSKGALP